MSRKTIGGLLIALALLLAVAGYRSLIDNLPYWQEFDKVVMTALGDLWQILMSPIVLAALAILLLLYFGRVPLLALLPALEVVRVGMFAAKFNQAALARLFPQLLSGAADRTRPAPPQPTRETPQEIQTLVSRIDTRVCRFFLELPDEPLKFEDLIERLAQAIGLPPAGADPVASSGRFSAGAGFFSAITSLLMGPIFMIEVAAEEANEPIPRLRIVVPPAVKELLRERVRESPRA